MKYSFPTLSVVCNYGQIREQPIITMLEAGIVEKRRNIFVVAQEIITMESNVDS